MYDIISLQHGSSLPTRFVFFRDSTFHLQFSSHRYGVFTYPGRYTRDPGVFTLRWETAINTLPWEATATVRGDTIDVRYNLNMIMSDFIDGPYVRVR